MPSIRIQQFGGMNTEVASRLAKEDVAQIAHNCLMWDGTLRPIAKWISVAGGFSNRYTIWFDGAFIQSSVLQKGIHLTAPVYTAGTFVGLFPNIVNSDRSNVCYQNNFTPIDAVLEVGVSAPLMSIFSTVLFTPSNLSTKPVHRAYACSYVRDNYGKLEESSLSYLPNQNFTDLHYEGDICAVLARTSDIATRERCHLRLYRSVSALETGQEIANVLDTDWYLVSDITNYVADAGGVLREYSYIDGGSPVAGPLDTYLAKHYYIPVPLTYRYIAATEGGWLAIATEEGNVQISERYMTHAWPTENVLAIPNPITSMVAYYDNIFIGTTHEPFIVTVGVGDVGTQINPRPFHEDYACMPGSMARTSGGALYASPAGLVALSQEGMKLITSGVVSSVRTLHHIEYTATDGSANCTDLGFQDTAYGAYFRGTYYGFCQVPTVDTGIFLSMGYTFDNGNTIDGDHPLQRFATYDFPAGEVFSHCMTNDGMAILVNTSVWTMALPGMPNKYSYEKAPKQCYQWKSKKYIFPGETTFAAAKVVHDCDGFVRLKLYCNGICVYDTEVAGNKPISLPPSVVGVEWEVEVHGTATVHEIHVATSIDELTEQ